MPRHPSRARRLRCRSVAPRPRWLSAFLVLLNGDGARSPSRRLAGNLVLPGDNLYQNEPLRVLTGNILRSGRLPAWDPFIWSGTPLLAGWNAGAMFPGTWLFASCRPGSAWTVNLALAYAVCSTGVHLLLRRIGVWTDPAPCSARWCSPTPGS